MIEVGYAFTTRGGVDTFTVRVSEDDARELAAAGDGDMKLAIRNAIQALLHSRATHRVH